MLVCGLQWGINMYFFSEKSNSFYYEDMKDAYIAAGTLPDDIVLVSDDIFEKYTQSPPQGKVRGIKKGMPAWIDSPPLTQYELFNIAEQQKIKLISEASIIIEPMVDAKNGGYIEKEDIKRLDLWQRYRYALTKVDISLTPNIEWPQKPE